MFDEDDVRQSRIHGFIADVASAKYENRSHFGKYVALFMMLLGFMLNGATEVVTPNAATVSFYDVDGKTLLASWTQEFGKPVHNPDLANIGISNGFCVAGWSPALPFAMPDHSMDFTALAWVPNMPFNVMFDTNGGSGAMPSVTFVWDPEAKNYGPGVKVECKLTRPGYTLAGWDWVWSTLTNSVDGYVEGSTNLLFDTTGGTVTNEFLVDPNMNFNKDVTLVAYWVKDATLTFDYNGGVDANGNTSSTGVYTWGGELVVPNGDQVKRDGYTLRGWVNNATGEFFALITDIYVPAEDTTFVACWSNGSPTFNVEDGVLTQVELNGATEIVIPNSVTNIGESAFSGCSGLTCVTIPNSVTNIGVCAFQDCSALTDVRIPSGVANIGWAAFMDCVALTNVMIPDSVRVIGYNAFDGCNESLFDTTSIPGVRLVAGWVFGNDVTLVSPLQS